MTDMAFVSLGVVASKPIELGLLAKVRQHPLLVGLAPGLTELELAFQRFHLHLESNDPFHQGRYIALICPKICP